MGRVILGAGLASDEDAFRFDAGAPTPPWLAIPSRGRYIAKTGIDEEVLQRVL